MSTCLRLRRWYVPPKRRLTQYLHGAISQKRTFFLKIKLSLFFTQNTNTLHVHNVQFFLMLKRGLARIMGVLQALWSTGSVPVISHAPQSTPLTTNKQEAVTIRFSTDPSRLLCNYNYSIMLHIFELQCQHVGSACFQLAPQDERQNCVVIRDQVPCRRQRHLPKRRWSPTGLHSFITQVTI
jgi:hypothetical protein